jgi:sugar O-acyltransferase (sialic acid O-acetyltransferase NeuD family)
MTKIKFGLLGAGGLGREVMPYVKDSISLTLSVPLDEITVLFVETWEPAEKTVNGYPLVSLAAFLKLEGTKYFNIAVGDGRKREAMVNMVGSLAVPISIHAPQAIFLQNNSIAEGAIFCPNTMVTANAKIGRFFQSNIYSYVAHDCVIGDFVTFAPGVRCNGNVAIDDYAYIGTNAVIREGSGAKPLRIGKGAVIGMGAVVTKDVPDGSVVVGNPARLMVKNGL